LVQSSRERFWLVQTKGASIIHRHNARFGSSATLPIHIISSLSKSAVSYESFWIHSIVHRSTYLTCTLCDLEASCILWLYRCPVTGSDGSKQFSSCTRLDGVPWHVNATLGVMV
jgi:hypothetical protein